MKMECNFIQLVVGTKESIQMYLYKPVKKARWMVDREDEVKHYCSNCKQSNSWGEVPFCPWCGADMRGEKE